MKIAKLAIFAFLFTSLAAWASSKVLPTGSEVVIRVRDAIDSTTAAPGQKFPAEIEQDVIDRYGVILIPKGSHALLAIRRVSGRNGTDRAYLALQAVTISGKRYLIDSIILSEPLRHSELSRAAEVIGRGAVLGDAVVGPASSEGHNAMDQPGYRPSGGDDTVDERAAERIHIKGELKVPPDVVLNFRLREPLELRER